MNDVIKYSGDNLATAASQLGRLSDTMSDVAGILSTVDTSGNWWSKIGLRTNYGGARELVQAERRTTNDIHQKTEDTISGIRKTQEIFDLTEKTIAGWIAALGGENPNNESAGTSEPKEDNFLEQLFDRIKTGGRKVTGKISEWVSAFKEDWENKGASYRIIKGLGSVVDIVAGGASLFGAILGTGLTAGLGTPATILIGTYGANTMFSGIADLVNCISGNVEQIGEVNLLKSGFSIIGGGIGDALGNKQMGESIGEAIYTVGGLTSTIVSINNLIGQIRQAPSAGSTLSKSIEATKGMLNKAGKELPNALKGLGYIITKSDLSSISYDMALLKMTIPNICDVCADVGLITKGVEYGKKLIDKGVDVVETLSGCTAENKPVFWDAFEQIEKVVSGPNDMKENFENIKDAKGVFSILMTGI